MAEAPELPPLPILPPEPASEALEGTPTLPELPQLNKPVICPGCDSRFEVPLNVQTTKCPVCGESIGL